MGQNRNNKIFVTIKTFGTGAYLAFFIVMLIYTILDSLKIIKNDLYVIIYGAISLIFVIIVAYFLLKHERVRIIWQKIFTVFAFIVLSLLAIKTFIPKLTVDFIRDAAIKAKTPDIKVSEWLAYFGSIYGAFIGAVLSVIGAVAVTLILNKIQESKAKKEQDHISNIIVNQFLSDEIKDNFSILNQIDENIMTYLTHDYNKYKESRFFHWENIGSLKFKNFNDIKYQIIKYENKTVIQTLETYRLFTLLLKLLELDKMDKKDFETLKDLIGKYYIPRRTSH